MSILDVLEAYSGNLVVDNTQKYVSLLALGAPVNFVNSAGLFAFRAGDNVYIESLRVLLPYQFGHAFDPITVELQWWQGGVTSVISEFGFQGKTFLPKPSIELPVNIQCQAPISGNLTFRMRLVSLTCNVSMQNVPAALNGDTYPATVQAVTRHTLDMTI